VNICPNVLKARTVEPEKQPLLGNGTVHTPVATITVRNGAFYSIRAKGL
jgi:hypothetical protein